MKHRLQAAGTYSSRLTSYKALFIWRSNFFRRFSVSSIQICLAGFVAKSRVWGAILSQTVPRNPHPLRLDDMPIGINHVAFNSGIGMGLLLEAFNNI